MIILMMLWNAFWCLKIYKGLDDFNPEKTINISIKKYGLVNWCPEQDKYLLEKRSGLTIGTRRWLNFLVASDFERGLKLSKRLVLRVGVVGESRPSSVWSSELPAPAAWGPHGRLFFLLTLKLTEPMVAVRGLIAELWPPT